MLSPKLQPLPKTEEEPEVQQKRTENRIVDISEYFSKEAFNLLIEAFSLAFSEKSSEVKIEHLLLTLTQKSEIVSLLQGESLKIIQEKIQELKSQPSGKETSFSGIVYFSPELKRVLLGAYFLAKQDSTNEVNSLHLFWAIGAMPIWEDIFSQISVPEADQSKKFSIPAVLSKFSKDLTEFSSSDFSFIGREIELEQILRILARENKHNVILLGEGGTGKSAMGLGISKLLVSKNLSSFTGARVLSLDLGGLFASPQSVSFFGPKIIEEIGTLPKIVFFLDQINLLTTSQQISLLVNFLQNLSKQGQVIFILSTTPSFYNQFLSSNPYFSSFFETIKLEEPSLEMTVKILALQATRMEKFHKVKIDPDIFNEVALLSKRYLPGNLPQKAISLLEETCASMSLVKKTRVGSEDIKEIVASKTGIPINSLTVSEKEKLNNLETILGKYVIGQKEAIKSVSEALRRARAGLKDPKKPIGSFLFLGPTGVGKTELAKTLARVFFDDEKAFIRLDMSEYSESHTAQRLIGSPPGYVGYEEGGQLTNPVIERPYCLILLDEIEKAHPRVFDLFLQVLDDGRLTDSQGKVVDFKNTLLIFTSNIAAEEIFAHGEDLVNPVFDKKAFFEGKIMPIVRQYFRPEFINRFDDLILFNPLTKQELIEIAKLKIKGLSERLKEKKINIEITFPTLSKLVEDSYNPSFGARPLERAIREQIENLIAQKIISGEIKEGETIRW